MAKQSSLVKPNQPALRITAASSWYPLNTVKPDGLIVDDVLYDNLVDQIDPIAEKLNRRMLLGRLGEALLFLLVMMVFYTSTVTSKPEKESEVGEEGGEGGEGATAANDDGSMDEEEYVAAWIFILILWGLTYVSVGALFALGIEIVLIPSAERFDKEISKITVDFRPRFRAAGYDIEYLIQHSGYCTARTRTGTNYEDKAFWAKTERVVVFTRIADEGNPEV